MAENREGKRVPQASFRTRTEGGDWKTITTDELFKGKNVVVFSLPGAFTPTCSSTHVPRYNELAPAFFANGIDRILCISVNDAFVMNEWARTQECGNVTMVPDGNGEFTAGMGMLVDKSELGFGKRSWRYSMLVRDGVIEKMFIEPEKVAATAVEAIERNRGVVVGGFTPHSLWVLNRWLPGLFDWLHQRIASADRRTRAAAGRGA